MVKKPRKRTGPAIPNRTELDSSASRAKSAEKYMARPATPPAEQPVATKENPEPTAKKPPMAEAVTPPVKAKKIEQTTDPIKPAEKPAAKDSARKPQSFAVRVLPAQEAQIEQIATSLNVDRAYMLRVLRTQTVKTLSDVRDNDAWQMKADAAKMRLSDPKGEGAQFFRTGLQMTVSEIQQAQKAINDPLGMIMPHAVVSAFAKVVFGEELEKLANKASS